MSYGTYEKYSRGRDKMETEDQKILLNFRRRKLIKKILQPQTAGSFLPIADDAASSMLEKGKRNKNGTKDIGIQAFDAILQLGVGCRLIA